MSLDTLTLSIVRLLITRKYMGTFFSVVSFFVSSTHETFVRTYCWFWKGGYRRLVPAVFIGGRVVVTYLGPCHLSSLGRGLVGASIYTRGPPHERSLPLCTVISPPGYCVETVTLEPKRLPLRFQALAL